MKKTIVALVAMGLVSTAGLGCPAKVDCDKMCTKTFKECVGEVLIAKGKLSQKKLDMIKKLGGLKKVQDAGYGACIKACKDEKGLQKDGAKINKCMKIKDCKKFAECMKDVN